MCTMRSHLHCLARCAMQQCSHTFMKGMRAVTWAFQNTGGYRLQFSLLSQCFLSLLYCRRRLSLPKSHKVHHHIKNRD